MHYFFNGCVACFKNRLFFIAFAVLIWSTTVYGQQDTVNVGEDTTDYDIRLLDTRYDRQKTETSLKAVQALLMLKTNVSCCHFPEFTENCDTTRTYYDKNPDSTFVTLKSGLSWEMSQGPPEQPKNKFKLLSKKGRPQPDVVDWMKYMDFQTACSARNGLATEMIDNITLFYTFDGHNSKACLQIGFVYKPANDNTFDLSERKVKRLND